MSRPRKPTEVLKFTGAFKKNPQRAEGRTNEPIPRGELGLAPDSLTPDQLKIWDDIVSKAAPGVLKSSDGLAVELAVYAIERARSVHRTAADIAKAKEMLQQFGMTPAARSNVQVKQEENGNEFAVA